LAEAAQEAHEQKVQAAMAAFAETEGEPVPQLRG